LAAKHAILAHHFENLEQQHEAGSLGMWVFLATEVMVFGTLFTGYLCYRASDAQAFAAAGSHLNVVIAAVNTVVLLTSSLTMALAVHATRLDRRRMLIGCLIITALLGAVFMLLKALEYYLDYRDRLVPGFRFDPGEWTERNINPAHVQLFFLFYYLMTGLHAVHLTIGIAVLLVLIFLAWRGSFSPQYYTPVDLAGLYWHFVDIIWIFLFPLLYLIGTHAQFS
jgi:cytochrome c oxidase subunit III